MIRRVVTALAGVVLLALPSPALAERLVTSLSTHRVEIASNFTGDGLVLFGSIEPDAETRPGRRYDLVVTVRGPVKSFTVRRKGQVSGLWVNVESRPIVAAPSYVAVMTTRALGEVTDPDTARRLRFGIAAVPLMQGAGPAAQPLAADDPFRAAFVRLRAEERLWLEDPRGVTFLTPNLFRTSIPIPAKAPIGSYEIETALLADGALLAREVSAFEVYKVGFEALVARTAQDQGLLYGLVAAFAALFVGWGASVVFRRD